MNKIIYMRVADNDGKLKVAVSSNPNYQSLRIEPRGPWLPTIAFAIELNIPDDLFYQAHRVVFSLDVDEEKVKTCHPILTVTDPQE